ncbi:MAG: carbon monoxide dehydrogenase subunit G [Pseudomonadota bacterium]
MDMSGSYRIPAPRDVVWAALIDPEILQQSIPGCQDLHKVSDTEFTAQVTTKIGPVKAKFAGDVHLEDLNPPESYRLRGEGKGGAAGFAKGGAHVRLAEDAGETVLTYEAHADIGGKLAQLGSRLVQGVAKKSADDFFQKFATVVTERHGGVPTEAAADTVPSPVTEEAAPAPAAAPTASATLPPTPAAETPLAQRPLVWLIAAVVLAVLVLLAI